MRKCSLGSKLLTLPSTLAVTVAFYQVAAGEDRAEGIPVRAGSNPGQGETRPRLGREVQDGWFGRVRNTQNMNNKETRVKTPGAIPSWYAFNTYL